MDSKHTTGVVLLSQIAYMRPHFLANQAGGDKGYFLCPGVERGILGVGEMPEKYVLLGYFGEVVLKLDKT